MSALATVAGSTSIRAGDLVTCIDDSPCRCGVCENMPLPTKKGSYYRVRDVQIVDGKPGLILDIAPGGPHLPGFAAGAFRKVQPATADFMAMLSIRPSLKETA